MFKGVNKKAILVVVALAVAAQIFLTLAKMASFSLAQTADPVPVISINVSGAAPYQDMEFTGPENFTASVSLNTVNLSGGSLAALKWVSYYLDNPTTSYIDAGFEGANASSWPASLSLYAISSLPDGTYDFYAKASYCINTYCSVPDYWISSSRYTITLNRNTATSSLTSTPTPTPTPRVASTIADTSTSTSTDTAYPSMPTSLVATKDHYNQVDLFWTASTDNVGVTGYEVWRSNGTWNKIGQSTAATYIDTTVSSSTGYYYKVIAYDAAGNKSYASSQLFLNTPASSNTTAFANSSPTSTPTPYPYTNTSTISTPTPTPTPNYTYLTPSPSVSIFSITVRIDDATAAGVPEGMKILKAVSVGPNTATVLESLTFYIISAADGNKFVTVLGNSTDKKNWSANFITAGLISGNYNLYAKGWYNNNYYKSNVIALNIYNPETSPYPRPYVSPKIYSSPMASVFPSPSLYTYSPSPYISPLPYSPVPYASTNPESNYPIGTATTALRQMPAECAAKNITDETACRQYMTQLYMPKDCLDVGAQTQEECAKIIMMKSLPLECQEAKTATEAECQKIMFAKNGLAECVEAGIYDQAGCEVFLFKKNAPPECLRQGITNPEECEKHMINKYGNLKNVPQASFPAECQNAGATTVEACDKIMAQKYMPQACRDQGINDPKQCELYMQKKYMPVECRDANAATDAECDKVMFKKFSPEPCKKAGIDNENECKDFMFNLYAPKIACDGLSDWDCKNKIKENHLGSIVSKQAGYDKVRREVASLSDSGAVKVETLKSKIEDSGVVIPIAESSANIKIVKAEEKMVLDKNNDLTQTASAALMVDSDNDDLTDDMERRLGTDPLNPDMDGDGFKDGAEVKAGYNPRGEGKIEEGKVAPIDEAILNNRTLSQPKVDGALNENYSFDKVSNYGGDNASGEEGNGGKYTFEGKAVPGEVVTLYLYSDLPVVVTVKTDKNGNWKYEFDKSLADGEHEAYVVLNDNTGKVVAKSNPLNFFINEAKAVSVQDYLTGNIGGSVKQSDKALNNFTYITIAIVALGIIVFVSYITIRNRRKQASKA